MANSVRLAIHGLVVALVVVSCQDPKPVAARQNISLIHYFSGSLSGGVDQLVETFNADHPNLQVSATALDHESFKTNIGESLLLSSPPELYSYWAGARTASLVDNLSPLDDIWKSAGLDSRFAPALVRTASEYNGHKYLLPLTQHLVGFFYNKRVLASLGKPEPRTWSEFLVLCEAARAAGKVPIALGASVRWPAQFWFDYILVRTAGPEFRRRLVTGQESLSSPPVVRAFTLWKDLLDRGYFSPDPTTTVWDSGAALEVRQGTALMTLMGTWLIGYYKGPDVAWAEDEIGFFPFPEITPGVPRAALGPIDGLVVAKNSMDPYGAMEVIRYLADRGPQQAFSQGSGALSPNLEVPDAFYSPLQREAKAEVAAAEEWEFAWDLVTPPAISEIGLSLFDEFLKAPGDLSAELARADAAIAAAR